jgi:hypothetical protein
VQVKKSKPKAAATKAAKRSPVRTQPEKIATPIAKRMSKSEAPAEELPEASEGSVSGSVNAREDVVVSVL